MATYSPVLGNPKPQYEDSNGAPYVGMRLFFYVAGTSTKQNTWTDSTGGTANSNPVVLDANGYPESDVGIYGDDTFTYKVVAAPAGSDDPPTSPLWTLNSVVISTLTASLSSTSDTTLGDSLVTHPNKIYAAEYLQTVSQILNGEEISIMRFIDTTYHSTIRDGTITTDLSGDLQTAHDTGANLFYPEGTYYFTTGLTAGDSAAGQRQFLRGAGKYKTIMNFVPSSTDVALTWFPNGVTNIAEDQVPSANTFLYQCGMQGFAFTGANSIVKTAVKLVNISEFIFKDINIISWSGTRSIGLHTKGSALLSAAELSINCDLPILLDVGATYGATTDISVDHFNFHNIYLIANNYPCVLGNAYGYWTNLSFTGAQAWVQGTHGLNQTLTGFSATGNTGTRGTVTINNLRTEQGQSSTSYSIRMEKCGVTRLTDCYLDVSREAIYLRGGTTDARARLDGGAYIGGSGTTALDVDSTVRELSWSDFFWQQSSTKMISGLDLQFAVFSRDEDYYSSAIYSVPNSAGTEILNSNSVLIQEDFYYSKTFTIAASGTQAIQIGGASKFYWIEIVGLDATAPELIGGLVIDYSTTDASILNLLMSSQGNFAVGNTAGKLCYDRAASNTSTATIRNNLANSVDVSVRIKKVNG